MKAARPTAVLALLAVGPAALGGCAEAPSRRDVDIRDLTYAPSSAAGAVGDTLVWTNRDLVPHTVTAVDGAWDSGPLAPGASWALTLDATRESVAYECIYHPSMTGSLIVR